jgi:3',5'-cyclic AMP phosphodiesterase CpdA
MLKLGLITDLHYASGVREGSRFCHLSLAKLQVALRAFQHAKVDAIIGLGDLVDSADTPEQEADFLRQVCHELATASVPVHLTPGNHCIWSLTKAEYCRITHQPTTWGSRDLGHWHLVFLDGCFRNDGVPYGRQNNYWTDAMVSTEQVTWLQNDLARATLSTLLFIHQRLDIEPPYGVSNAPTIRAILEQSGKVRGVFQGHEHAGAKSLINTIPYTTLPAMVEGSDIEAAAFTILEATDAGEVQVLPRGSLA